MNVRRALLTSTGTLAAAGVLVGAALAVHVRRHRPLLAQVAPDLRTPSLAAPLSVRGPVTLGLMRRLLANDTAAGPGVEVREVRVGEVRVLVYRPLDTSAPIAGLLWLHGGGFVMGRPEGDHPQSSWLAAELGVVVVSVDYRLAPEHPFPAGLDDASAALTWMHENAHDLGIDPARLAVGGASAGGGMAATLAQRAHDEGRVPVRFQLLVYPALDDRTAARPLRERRWLVWTARSTRFAWTSYLGRAPGGTETRPYAAAARRDDLAGLPRPGSVSVTSIRSTTSPWRTPSASRHPGSAAACTSSPGCTTGPTPASPTPSRRAGGSGAPCWTRPAPGSRTRADRCVRRSAGPARGDG